MARFQDLFLPSGRAGHPGGGCIVSARQERRQAELAALRSALPIGNGLLIYFGGRGHFLRNCSGTNLRPPFKMDVAAAPGRVYRGS
jgi:hypothetical protein